MEIFIVCRACMTETIVMSETLSEYRERKRQLRRRNQKIRRRTQ